VPHIDLGEVCHRLADRRPSRAEANVQSDVRLLLLAAGLNLRDGDLLDVVLEAPVGVRRRIDVEVGATVLEVKKDLRVGNVRSEAVGQLAGYVRDRIAVMGTRYVGVLTDGAEWHLYHLDADDFSLVSSFYLDQRSPDADGLCIWLDGVLATRDQIIPTPAEIERRLGAGTPAHALDIADLMALFRRHRRNPSVALKRELWAKLLTTALGTSFSDEDELFVEHTLLVATAEIIGHAVIGFDPADPSIGAATLLGGHLFAEAQIRGAVEEDFFDWVIEVPGGEAFVKTLAHRLSRFRWSAVEHDVMKVLYESVIGPETRHSLGEYYTPDWLAEAVVETVIEEPLTQRALDPACGSGTFLFHAVRRYLRAAEEAGLGPGDAISGVTNRVYGVDVHPVAVTLARITYLLAIGRQLLASPDRPPFSVPVYLGDAVQWGQTQSLLNTEALVVPTNDGAQLFADELRFPDRVVEDAGRFDSLVAELADIASRPGRSPSPPSLAGVFRRYAIHPEDQPTINATFATMCSLHDEGRNHIWGYYVRNLARPLWLSRRDNRMDVLMGNPPWLSYRFMPADMKANFRAMCSDRGFWAGSSVATHQDLSALFAARAVEQYLRIGGRFGFVMPLALLSRRQFEGFRSGHWGSRNIDVVEATFEGLGTSIGVKPSFFPVPASAVFGTRSTTAKALRGATETWAGRLTTRNPNLETARQRITRTPVEAANINLNRSPYHPRFLQGAALVPKLVVFVEDGAVNPLGAGAGRRSVRSRRSSNEKRPWKDLPGLSGSIERQFLRPVYVGDSVLPFLTREPQMAVIPWDGTSIAKTVNERLDLYPGLRQWWQEATRVWETNRGATNSLSLDEQLDYRRKLSEQLPGPTHRVVYNKSGMYLASTYLPDSRAIIDQQLYWAAVSGRNEARYLTAILNSDELLQRVRPLQSRGEHNPRHFDKLPWEMGIPLFEPGDKLHQDLVALAIRAEQVSAAVELPSTSFQSLRRLVRGALGEDGVAARIDEAVRELLG
jgi:SAM-dependent methyltransferase